MKIVSLMQNFAKDESGAVTVDWVVLTAAIVGLGLAVLAVIRPATTQLATRIAAKIDLVQPE